MEIDKITLEREFLDKLLSLNYLNESDWAELESLVNLLQNDFTCKVRQNFPMLSRDDIHYSALIIGKHFCSEVSFQNGSVNDKRVILLK